MLNASSKKFKKAQVGDSSLIPISQPDKISSLGPRNILQGPRNRSGGYWTNNLPGVTRWSAAAGLIFCTAAAAGLTFILYRAD